MAAAYNPRGARKARKQVRVLKRRLRKSTAASKQSKQYDPLAPLTGPRAKQEMRASERLEFGPRQQELTRATANQAQTAADRATYFDDWKDAMRRSTANINEANRVNVEQTQTRIDAAHQADTARLATRDAQDSATAAKFGRAPVRSEEGAQAVSAQRSQGEQSLARLRGQSANDTALMEKRTANVSLKKIEDQQRLESHANKLREEDKKLASERGAFRVDQRRKNRESEREWSAIQKEFGLKRRGQDLEFKNTRADRAIEKQKIAGQKIIARLYSSADKKSARAQVRVAQLQLEKGKISRKKFVEIKNIYEGLPERPSEFTFNHNSNGGKPGDGKDVGGSGPGGALAPWEKDRVGKMTRVWKTNSVKPSDKADAFKRMRKANPNMQDYLIRIAWRRYVKQYGANLPDNLPSYPTP
jgi:hypothetical protein